MKCIFFCRRNTICWDVTIYLWVVYQSKKGEQTWKLLLSQGKVSKLENYCFSSIPLDIFLELYIVLYPYIPNPFNMHLQIASANASQIIQSLHTGFIPVSFFLPKVLNHYPFRISYFPRLLAWVICISKKHMVLLEYVSYLLVTSCTCSLMHHSNLIALADWYF